MVNHLVLVDLNREASDGPMLRSVSWVNSVLRQFLPHGPGLSTYHPLPFVLFFGSVCKVRTQDPENLDSESHGKESSPLEASDG